MPTVSSWVLAYDTTLALVGSNLGDAADFVVGKHQRNVVRRAGAQALDADLHDLAAEAAARLTHSFGMFHVIGHRFFDLDVRPSFESINEERGVQVKRRRDDHSIEIFAREHVAVVEVSANVGRNLAGFGVTQGEDIRYGDKIRVFERQDLSHELFASETGADDADPEPDRLGASGDRAGRGQGRRPSKEGASRIHGVLIIVSAPAAVVLYYTARRIHGKTRQPRMA